MILYPNAKINIGLNVVEKRPDGYHNLETVFYPIPLLDALEVKPLQSLIPESGYSLKVTGTVLGGTPDDNLIIRAYKMLRDEYRLPPVSFYIYKHIPTGAGLGGGSADAAFTLRALNEQFKLGLDNKTMEKYAARLGADCAFFVENKPVFATGIGNEFHPFDFSLKGKVLVLVKPDVFVSTKDAYSNVTPAKPAEPLTELLKQPVETWKDTVVNDFEKSVFVKYPEIACIKDKLYDLGAVYASMSGSGSSVYGIFNETIENIDEIFAGYFCRQRVLE